MIISKTPLRMSFLGGGTDYPVYFSLFGGQTLVASIDRYTTITVNPLTQFVDYRLRIHYSQVESVKNIDEIKHPSARECLRFMKLYDGIEIHYLSDLPARTGLGSSSSATVGLLMALHAFKGESVTQERVAQEAIIVEQEFIKEDVGCQDQYSCALGGLLHLEFLKNKEVISRRILIDKKRMLALQDRLMLFYTGIQRDAQLVLDEQLKNTKSGQSHRDLEDLKALVGEGINVLNSNQDLISFGKLLHEGWLLKRRLSNKITNNFIDDIYQEALEAGAVGGKLLGAGGGGFLLLFVQPENQQDVRTALSKVRQAEFAFEEKGSHIIFDDK